MQISGFGENSILSSHTMGGSVMASSNINSVHQAKIKRTGYHQKALAEIRNSLQPFANESSSMTPSSFNGNLDSHVRNGTEIEKHIFLQRQILHRLLETGYDEDISIKAIEYSGGRSFQAALDWLKDPDAFRSENLNGLLKVAGGKIIRKPSFEHDICILRGSPALDSSTASTRSDSPGVILGFPSVSSPSQTPSPPRQYTDPPHLGSQNDVPVNFASHVSRQYSPNFHEPPPPPPPPRNQGPPPTPPRGTTPPPPPRNNTSSQQYPYMPSSVPTNVQQILKRMSPVPPNNTKAQRGTSPVSFAPRQPIILQNNPQVQQQITQQLQALNLYQGNMSGPGNEPPPPYPLGQTSNSGALQNASKLSTPPPSYQASIQARQSPTQSDVRKVPSPGGIMYSQYAPVCSSGVSPTPRPGTLQSLSARQAKTQPPIIMHSVKSTQVQKPILQTAVAPPCPPASSPPPSYNSSSQVKTQQTSCAPYQQGDSVNLCTAVINQSPTSFPHPTSVPTTDPPSYASTIQALAVQRGLTSQTPNCNPSCPLTSTTPVITTISSVLEKNATNNKSHLEKLPNGVKCQSDPCDLRTENLNSTTTSNNLNNNCHLKNNLNCIKMASEKAMNCKGINPRKLSPLPSDTTSSASRSESPLSATASHCNSQSPVSFISTTSTPSTQSESTQDSSSTPSSRSSNTPFKTTHQSPIPERKSINKEREEERRESRVRNYTPQAFKFYMEQHIENVLKSYQQRLHRRMQLENEMTKVGLSAEAQHQMRRMLSQKESNYIRLKRAKMDKSMFTKIKPIGVGAFGEVDLVRKIDTRHLYAMKILRKNNVLKRNQVAHVKAERDILAEADNEWVVKLYYSFQDKDNLYFVMDYIPGGDLMSLLIKLGVFQESLARFYIAELVCAIESVHKMGFTHRDIKPDNILIDRDGHIKLTDFGLCTGFRWTHNSKYYQSNGHHHQDSMEAEDWKIECHCHDNKGALKPLERRRHREHSRCLAHSLVGTPNYIAPEVLSRTGYTQLCDWWSVGVILYEMVVGQPPFLANTPAETQYKVINWKSTLKVPKQANLSPQSKDLILKLCTGPDDRLGKKGASEVKSHPFFSVLNLDHIRRLPAPYLPKITSPTDTSNFDPVDPDKLMNSDSSGDETSDFNGDKGKHPEHAFFEFTFRRFFDDGGHAYSLKLGLEDHDPQSPVYV